MAQRRPSIGILADYLPYLQTRWFEGIHNGSQLFREIQDQGYAGSRSMVGQWVAAQRRTDPAAAGTAQSQPNRTQSSLPRPWSARYAVWLCLRPPAQLSADHRLVLQRMLQASPTVHRAYNFAQAFGRIVRARFSKALDPWLAALAQSDLAPLKGFAAGLERDKSAVLAALASPWSNGQTEGQVNRLKLIKRQMYGRAKFDLLRLRVLAA